jgi:endonuclease III related protein
LVIETKGNPNYPITKLRNCQNFLRVPRFWGEIIAYYRALLTHWGPQNWWPGRSCFEVIVGAYLTQNTSWRNVEKAISDLRQAHVLSIKGLRQVALRRLEKLVQPSGYFRKKAKKLKTFIRFLDKDYGSSIDRMLAQPTERLREELLALNGVGPETADSILLYTGNHPVFVVDAYTRSLLERHGMVTPKTGYEEIREPMQVAVSEAGTDLLVGSALGNDPRHPASRMSRASRSQLAQHYNELHALIVRVGNAYCRSTPKCEDCPLREFLLRG